MLTLRFMAENVEKPKHAGAKENLIRAKIFWPKIFRKPEAVQDILLIFPLSAVNIQQLKVSSWVNFKVKGEREKEVSHFWEGIYIYIVETWQQYASAGSMLYIQRILYSFRCEISRLGSFPHHV